MSRSVIETEVGAKNDLGSARSLPSWLERQHSLPFGALSADEFEVLSFLLLLAEHAATGNKVTYYGKTADLGRDIVIETPSTRKLIQCKHFDVNVGLPHVRVEIAKLVSNIHAGAIPRIDEVSFYVSRDLTSPAIDYLREASSWRGDAPTALAEHLGEAPSPELLAFAMTWWPRFDHQSGLLLTSRLRNHRHLIDQFFSEQKVVTGDVSAVLSTTADLKRGQDQILELLVRAQKSPAEGMQDLLRRAEEMNPGLSFAAEVNAKGETTYTVSAKSGAGSVPVGTLRFSGVVNGAVGAQKLSKALREGRAVELKEGEFEWVRAVRFPETDGIGTQSLKITPQVPKIAAPVQLEAIAAGEDKPAASIEFCTLVPVRAGSDEFELEIRGGAFAGSMRLVHRKGGPHNVQLTLNLGALHPARALASIRLIQSLQRGAMLRVRSLETGLPLMELQGLSAPEMGPFEPAANLLSALARINSEFGIDVRYPEGAISDEDGMRVELLAHAIEHGRVATRPPNDLVFIDAPRDMALGMLNALATRPANLALDGDEPVFNIFGTSVSPGERRLIVVSPEVVGDIEAQRSAAASSAEDRSSGSSFEVTASFTSIRGGSSQRPQAIKAPTRKSRRSASPTR